MTILLIRQASPDPLPVPAQLAGHAMHCAHCATLPALVACLREATLSAALDALPAPYIEMAANDDDGLDAHLHPQHAPAATVVCSSGRADACRLSLAIAERRLLSAAGRA